MMVIMHCGVKIVSWREPWRPSPIISRLCRLTNKFSASSLPEWTYFLNQMKQ